ncbi:hypothetical protein [Crocinitomix algicola]|uniref:hypothetical protein n=1 Tax=Crocinitomix algicola TaxID=1740263 RepID=UPI0008324A9F|nr:hypothetical protein [Crocinitomix algicola]
MIGRLIKRKLDSDRLANVFVNALMEAIDNGFDDVCAMINDDSAFILNPEVDERSSDKFLLVVIVGNLRYLDDYFEVEEAREIHRQIIRKFAGIFNLTEVEFEEIVQEYDKFISRVNHPSKNTLYGMSKAIFHKFNLNDFQETYFRSMHNPNPLFLKRMDEIMMNFLWDWDAFFKKHRLQFN